MHLKELKKRAPAELVEMAEEYEVEGASTMRRQDLMFAILKEVAEDGEEIIGQGTIEVLQDGFGFLRSPEANYLAGPDDIYVSPNQVRKSGLQDRRHGRRRDPRAQGRRALFRADQDQHRQFRRSRRGPPPHQLRQPDPALSRRAAQPRHHRSDGEGQVGAGDRPDRPQGKGQRALIVAPPRTGKTVLLQNIAKAITDNHPEVFLIVLLVDERPEEVTDMQRSVKGEVISSTFDEPATRHVQVAEMVIEKAKRLVEHKKDVVILLDSITRLGRAYNTVVPSSGKVLTGGVDANALQRPEALLRRRAQHRGRRLAVDHRHRADRHRQPHGRGHLRRVQGHRQLRNRARPQGLRQAHLPGARRRQVRHPQGRAAGRARTSSRKMWVLRRILMQMGTVDAMEFLLDKMKDSKSNEDFFATMNQ